MNKPRLLGHLLGAALAAVSLLATTSAAVAKDEVVHKHHKVVKKTVKQKKKTVKPAARAAAQPVAAARPSTDVQSRITKPGDYRFAIQHAGLTRTYRVHVPPRYTPTEPTPLLVALHGGGIERVGDDGFDSLARASDFQNFIAVYPDAYVGRNKKASWNAGNCCGEARDRKVNDVGFIEQVVNNVFSQASIDRQRIYAAGMSDGGMMAYRLACELPFVFRAIASVGGTDNTVSCRPGREVSVLHLHAKNDARVPFNGSAVAEAADNGKLPPLASAPETVKKWAQVDGCAETPRRVLEQAGAFCEAYTYCRRQTEVRMCVTDTGGHSWPGAKARAGAPSPSPVIAGTETMWSFFIAH